MGKIYLIGVLCFLFLLTACDHENTAPVALTDFEKRKLEVEAMEKEGCLYQGKLYSRGALKFSMKAGTNAEGQTVMLNAPDGIPMICEYWGRDSHRWVVATQYSNNSDE